MKALCVCCLVAGVIAYAQLAGQTTKPAPCSADVDFAALRHYAAVNEALQKSSKVPVKVVFLGDSITENWGKSTGIWFSNPEWINRGIGGQTTAQLLLRTRSDAIELRPRVLVIEGGTNDMRDGVTPEQIRDNIASIAELARAHHIKVMIASMMPVCDCFRPLSGLRTVERIRHLNSLLQNLCKKNGWHYLDFNTPLADQNGNMKREFTVDGVHPNADGYRALLPVCIKALKHFG